MKKLAIAAIAFLTLSACKKNEDSGSTEKMQIISAETDSTRYGIVIRIDGDSLKWLSEYGDTLWSNIRSAEVLGSMSADHRLALLFQQGSNHSVKNAIDLTDLVGRWVEPDPVDEGMVQGIELEEVGTANSINSRSNHYVSWRLYNGKLLLVDSYEGIIDDNVPEDTLRILRLTADSMNVTIGSNKHFYRKSNSADEDIIRDYSIENLAESDAFDPEGEAPQGSDEQEIPEIDRIF